MKGGGKDALLGDFLNCACIQFIALFLYPSSLVLASRTPLLTIPLIHSDILASCILYASETTS